jgi:hypothetical protein
LETPLFYNSPEVKKVLKDITSSRNALLYVANELMSIESEDSLIASSDAGEQELGD